MIIVKLYFLEQFTEKLNFPESTVPLLLPHTTPAPPHQFPLLLTSCLSVIYFLQLTNIDALLTEVHSLH